MRGSQKLLIYDDIKTVNALFGWYTPLDPRCLLCLMKGQIPLINRKEWMMVALVKLSNHFYFGDKHLEVKDGDSQLPGSLFHHRLQWQCYTSPSVRLPKINWNPLLRLNSPKDLFSIQHMLIFVWWALCILCDLINFNGLNCSIVWCPLSLWIHAHKNEHLVVVAECHY